MPASNPEPEPRAMLRFRLADAPARWPIVVGASNETESDVRDRLRARYGERLIETARYQDQP